MAGTSIATGIMFYLKKMYLNNIKLMILPPLLTYVIGKIYIRWAYHSVTFDDIERPLPDPEIEKQRQEIINMCLLSDYTMNMNALKQELEISRPPADYIYTSLL